MNTPVGTIDIDTKYERSANKVNAKSQLSGVGKRIQEQRELEIMNNVSISVCQCDEDFTCEMEPVSQNDPLSVCITPSSASYSLLNYSFDLSGVNHTVATPFLVISSSTDPVTNTHKITTLVDSELIHTGGVTAEFSGTVNLISNNDGSIVTGLLASLDIPIHHEDPNLIIKSDLQNDIIVSICQCGINSFECFSNPEPIEQDGSLMLCLFPDSNLTEISNLEVQMCNSAHCYLPVTAGENGYEPNALTLVDVDRNSNALRVGVAVVGAFFQSIDKNVYVTGYANLQWINTTASKTIAPVADFGIVIQLHDESNVNSLDQEEESWFQKSTTFLRSIIGLLRKFVVFF